MASLTAPPLARQGGDMGEELTKDTMAGLRSV